MQKYRELTHQERCTIAATEYGLYAFGLAATEAERIDEVCALDNMRIPWRVPVEDTPTPA